MFPIVINPARMRIAVAGDGAAAARRLKALEAAGVDHVIRFADVPDVADLKDVRLLLIAGIADGKAAALVELARAMGILVNVEDRKAWCDFHLPAVTRRGDLVIAVSTNGRSPGLARRIRRHIDGLFGPEWQTRLDEMARERGKWRQGGMKPRTLARLTNAFIDRQRWLG
ncbi:MAG: NAD(P)-dependent oxidoreductase [Alphaproteobacteria bacterium]